MWITGLMVNYYFICPTKLWFFSRGITLEQESDLVLLGRLVHQEFYGRERKNVVLGRIALDFIRKGDIWEINEVKRSGKMEEADVWQVKYYLYYLEKNYGIRARGVIRYPRERKVVRVEGWEGIEEVLKGVKEVVGRAVPPKPVRKPYCRKCAYKELCFG